MLLTQNKELISVKGFSGHNIKDEWLRTKMSEAGDVLEAANGRRTQENLYLP